MLHIFSHLDVTSFLLYVLLTLLASSPQDEIVESVQREVDAALMSSNKSRTYYSNQVKLVPVTGADFK